MNYISSLENKFFKEVCSLSNKRYRYLTRSYLIEGVRFIEEAIRYSCDIKYIILSESKKDQLIERFGFQNKSFNIMIFSDTLFSKIQLTKNSQGIVACLEMKNYNHKFSFNKGIYFLIDKIQDPGNLGTIIRTAVAVNALGVILVKGCVDLYNDKVLRATMGSIFKINIYFIENYQEINELIENDFKLIIADMNGDENYYNEDLTGKIILTVGNEGNGISQEIKGFPHKKVRIPMSNGLESLNVAQAISIISFEHVRQINS